MHGGSRAVSLACIISISISTAFPGGLSLRLAFGSFFSFFYPHPSSPFLFPLINQCDMCLARIYYGLVQLVECGVRMMGSELNRTRRKRGEENEGIVVRVPSFSIFSPVFFPRRFFYRVLPFECLEQANQGLAFPKLEAPGQTRHPSPLNEAFVKER